MTDHSILVRPRLPPVPGCIRIPPLDQLPLNRYVFSYVFAFSLSSDHSKEEVKSVLEGGLQATLEEIPFLVADVVPYDIGRGSIQLEISEADGAGIKFQVKDFSKLHFNEIERRGFPTVDLKQAYLAPKPVSTPDKIPVLAVQANFVTGGLLLALSLNHAIFDGVSVVTLLTQWAKHTAAISMGQVLRLEEKIQRAELDRLVLFRGLNNMGLSEFPAYRAHEFPEGANNYLMNKMRGLNSYHFDLSVWRSTDRCLKELERIVCGADPSKFSSNAILSAFLWQRITKARQLSRQGYSTTNLLFPVDIRNLVVPPLSPRCIGNCIVETCATASVEEMESSGPEFLYELSERITSAQNWWTSNRVLEFIGAVNNSSNLVEFSSHFDTNPDTYLGSDFVLTNMSTSELHLDWGSLLGKIKAVRPMLPSFEGLPGLDGIVAVWPKTDFKGIEFGMGFLTKTMQRLMDDELWMSIMKPVCSERFD